MDCNGNTEYRGSAAGPAPVLVDEQRIPAEAWRRLVKAGHDPLEPMRYMTLATLGLDGRPAARLMTLRGACPRTRRLWFHTRRHSPKIAELRAAPACSLVAFDPRDGVQLRALTRAIVHERDDLARDHWAQVSRTLSRAMADGGPALEELAHAPDTVWPDTAEDLARSLKFGAWEAFAVVELTVDSLEWTQALGHQSRRLMIGEGE